MNENEERAVVRVLYFFSLNPPEFLGSQTNEDPQKFIDEIKKILEVMHVTRNDRVEFATY